MADEPQEADSATIGAPRHGAAEPRGQDGVPLSPLHEGRFGRIFRDPQPLDPGLDAINALTKLVKESGSAAAGDNAKIPAGYTYLGQFVDHDITFDPLSKLQKDNDPDALVDFRTPRFDLDSLYGSGPDDEPFMYEWSSPSNRGVKLLVGRNPSSGAFDIADLPRNQQGRALIGDPRNDENIIVSQLQLLFIRFHNKVVDRTRANQKLEGAALFEEAQRITRWHYQWIVVHDFLQRIVGKQMAESVLKPATATTPPTTDLQFFRWQNDPFMPVEFSGAAYRFGHSMVRATYDLNAVVTGVPIFAAADKPGPLEHLGGFRRLPSAWTIDWSHFFKTTASARPQLSRKIDTSVAAPLHKLPPGLDRERHALPQLNLRRGRALGLPSGQDVAAAMAVTPLTAAQLGLDRVDLPPEGKAALQRATPLWFYILREAAVLGKGERLGRVGGRIVAEVLVGLLAGDPQSYLSRKPAWTPILPSAKKDDFTMPDLVRFALG